MADRRVVTLWELMVWTYRDQKAHWYLRRPVDWFLWAIAEAEPLDDMPRPDVHRDAAAVHAAVRALPQRKAGLVVFHARNATQPEPPLVMPTPGMVVDLDREGSGEGERWGWAERNGRRVDYLIRTLEHVVVVEPVFERIGRKKFRAIGERATSMPVEYCPIVWEPDPAWIESERAVHADWTAAMEALYAELSTIAFSSHELVGRGFDPAIPQYEPLIVQDVIAALREKQLPRPVVMSRPDRIIADADDRLYAVRRRASIG